MAEAVKVTKVTQNLDKISKEDLMPGIPATALPTPEFIAAVKRIEEKKKDTATTATLPSVPPPAPITKKPLILRYQWTGTCETCGREVKTIQIEGEKFDTVVCYCIWCDKQINSQRVINIAKQFKEDKNGSKFHQAGLPV